jgi:hypothetical protein
MFYEIAMHTELVDTESLFLGEMQGWILVSFWS